MHFERLRQLLIQKAIEGKLVPQLAEESAVGQIGEVPKEVSFEIPGKWKWVSLNMVVTKHLGGGTPTKEDPSYWGGNICWASVKDLKGEVIKDTQDKITEEGLKK